MKEFDKMSIFSSSNILTSLSNKIKLKYFVHDIENKHHQLSTFFFKLYFPIAEIPDRTILIAVKKKVEH